MKPDEPNDPQLQEPIQSARINSVPAIWIRPPIGKSVCPYTHLRHAQFNNEFVGNPRIRQCRLGAGRTRGTRLIYLPDVLRELYRLAREQGTPGIVPPAAGGPSTQPLNIDHPPVPDPSPAA